MTPDSPNGPESEALSRMLRGMARRATILRRQAERWHTRAQREFHERVTDTAKAMAESGQLRAEVSRLREQLAAQTEQVERTRRAERRSIASVLTGMLEELEAAYVHEVGAGPAQTLDKLRAVQAFSVDLFATSGPVELEESEAGVSSSEVEAPQPQEMTQHKVEVKPQGGGWWKAECAECDLANYTRRLSEAEDWKDRHEAGTLRPQVRFDNPSARVSAVEGKPPAPTRLVSYEPFEGRPSGSERLAPRPSNLAVWVDDDEREFDVKILDITKIATIQFEDGELKEVLLHELQPRQDAAQAARSVATPHPDQALLLAKVEELKDRGPVQYATEEAPLRLPLSVRKEKTVSSAGKYVRVFDAIGRHAYTAAKRHVDNYGLARDIADSVRTVCSAGMTPVLDALTISLTAAYLCDRDERRRPVPLDDIAVQLAWHAEESRGSDERYRALYDIADQVLALRHQPPAVSSQEETKEGETDDQA